jgi:hypothetical protein
MYNNENNVPEALNSAEIDPLNIKSSSESQDKLQQVNIRRHLIECNCAQEETLKLDTAIALKITTSLMSMQMRPISSVRLNEPFLLLCDVKNNVPYSLKLSNSFVKTVRTKFLFHKRLSDT